MSITRNLLAALVKLMEYEERIEKLKSLAEQYRAKEITAEQFAERACEVLEGKR